jgi:hypothetical protein
LVYRDALSTFIVYLVLAFGETIQQTMAATSYLHPMRRCSLSIRRKRFAADVPDGDSVEGYTLIVGFSFLVFTLLIHIAVLAVLGFKRIQQAI